MLEGFVRWILMNRSPNSVDLTCLVRLCRLELSSDAALFQPCLCSALEFPVKKDGLKLLLPKKSDYHHNQSRKRNLSQGSPNEAITWRFFKNAVDEVYTPMLAVCVVPNIGCFTPCPGCISEKGSGQAAGPGQYRWIH